MNTVVSALRATRAAVTATFLQTPRRRYLVLGGVVVILLAVATLVPLPTALQLRDWATAAGPWFPLAFLTAHVVVTVFPFPRTAFTLAAGLLFGPLLGVPLAVVASTVSALIALLLVRAAGLQLHRLRGNPRLEVLNARLRQRGWPAVMSMRLIPAVPFSVLNYAAGASAVRAQPYTLATFAGLLPGTAAVVILGDALTGSINPLLLVVSAGTACIGICGLAYEARRYRRESPAPVAAEPPSARLMYANTE